MVRYVKSAIFAEVTGERIYERTQEKGRWRGLREGYGAGGIQPWRSASTCHSGFLALIYGRQYLKTSSKGLPLIKLRGVFLTAAGAFVLCSLSATRTGINSFISSSSSVSFTIFVISVRCLDDFFTSFKDAITLLYISANSTVTFNCYLEISMDAFISRRQSV